MKISAPALKPLLDSPTSDAHALKLTAWQLVLLIAEQSAACEQYIGVIAAEVFVADVELVLVVALAVVFVAPRTVAMRSPATMSLVNERISCLILS